MVNLEFSEYYYFDDVLSDLKYSGENYCTLFILINNWSMVNLEFSEYHYFDDVLSSLKLTPVRTIVLYSY